MKTLRIALIALISLVAIALIYLSTLPKGYSVRRSVEIEAPVAAVQNLIVDLPRWEEWSEWSRIDSTNKTTYSDPAIGKGAWYSWKGEITGEGKLEIVDVQEGKSVATAIQFTKPFESLMDSRFEFKEADGKTVVEWINEGTMPFLLRFMNSGMDKNIGGDLEKGLASLKKLAEVSTPIRGSIVPAEVVTVAETPYLYVRREVSPAEITSELYAAAYAEVMTYMAEDAAKLNGPVFAVSELWDETAARAVLRMAVPYSGTKQGNGSVMKDALASGKAVKVRYTGPYEGTWMGHDAAMAYVKANGLSTKGFPWEVYVNDPAEVKDPALYITDLYYPVE